MDKIILMADDKQIAQYPGKGKSSLNEIQSVSSWLPAGTHKLSLMVIDKEGYANTKDMTVTVVWTDSKAPEVLQDKTVVKKLDSGKVQVTIVLQDDLSYIAKGSVSKNGSVVASFGGNLVTFTTDDTSPVQVSATDAYGNKWETTIQLQ